MGRARWLIGVLGVVAATALVGSSSAAAEAEVLTRDEYVVRLETMCKPGALATKKAMKGARKDVGYERRLPVAVRKFGEAARIFGGTIKKIGLVPRPPADVGRLEEWFTYLNRQEQYLLEITEQLRASHTIKAQ